MVIQMLMLVVTHRWKAGMRAMASAAATTTPAIPPKTLGLGHIRPTKLSRNTPQIAVNQEARLLPPMGM